MKQTVDNYLDSIPEDAREQLSKIRAIIKSTVKESIESISYGMPSYKYKGKPLAYFAAFTNHVSFFPMPSVLEKFKKELEGYTTTKAAMHIPLGKKVPKTLIKKMLKERMKEIGMSNKKTNKNTHNIHN